MEIVNKEEERTARENTPEGRKKKLIKNVVIGIAVVAFLAYVYLDSHHPAFIGTPHPVVVAGFSIEPGKTTVQELAAAGFELSSYDMKGGAMIDGEFKYSYEQVYELSSEVDEKSYFMNLDLIRGEDKYATLEVVNESPSKKALSECLVRSVTVYDSDTDSLQSSVDGVSGAVSIAALTAATGEPEKSDTADGETTVSWKKGYYSMNFIIKEDGSGYHFQSKYEKK